MKLSDGSKCERPDPNCMAQWGGPHTCWVTVEHAREGGGEAGPGMLVLGLAFIGLFLLAVLIV